MSEADSPRPRMVALAVSGVGSGVGGRRWQLRVGLLAYLLVGGAPACDKHDPPPKVAAKSQNVAESPPPTEPAIVRGPAKLPGAPGLDQDSNNADRPPEAAAASAGCRSWQGLEADLLPELPVSPYTKLFEVVWRTLLDKHPDPTLNCQNWPAMRLEYAKQLQSAEDRDGAYAIINRMLASLGHSHLMAMPPPWRGRDGQTAAPKTGPARLPFKLHHVEGEALIEKSPWGRLPKGLPRGSQLLAIDEHPIATPQPGRRHRDFSQHYALERMMQCPRGGQKKLTLRPPKVKPGRTVERTIECIMPGPEFRRTSLGNLRNLPTRVESKMLPGKLGLLRFNYWMMPMYAEIAAAVHALRSQGMRGLIIDLRGNPGGLAPMTIPVGRLFFTEDAALGELKMRDFSQHLNIRGSKTAFTGPMAVLIDGGSASTSEIFALGMREAGRVKVVGSSASAGMALPSLIETLPDGGLLQYVVGEYRSAKGRAAEGDGVMPDVSVKETRADVIAGRDVVLEAAREALLAEL